MTGPALPSELKARLVGVLERVSELAGRQLTLEPLSGGITNRNFLVRVDDEVAPGSTYVLRLPGNDTHLLGISREVEYAATVAAAGVGIGPEVVAFIRPEGYLLTRFIVGEPIGAEAVHEARTIARVADSIRRFHQGPPIPGIFVPFRIGEAYGALAAARGVAIPAEYEEARVCIRQIERAFLEQPVEMCPCHNDLLNANFLDDGRRIFIVDWEYAGMGDPFFDLGNFSVNNELTPDEDAVLLGAYEGGVAPSRLARLRLMRLVSDFREAMWGVLQQGISSLDVDFRSYAASHFRRLLSEASGPEFGQLLRLVRDR